MLLRVYSIIYCMLLPWLLSPTLYHDSLLFTIVVFYSFCVSGACASCARVVHLLFRLFLIQIIMVHVLIVDNDIYNSQYYIIMCSFNVYFWFIS